MPARHQLVLLVVLVFTPAVHAADWPQFLGPDRNAQSAEQGLLRAWPAEGPKLLWSADLGPGFGSAAIVAGKVYVLDRADGAEAAKDILRCLDAATGKEDWNASYDAPGKVDYPGPRGTPTISGNLAYTVGPMGHFNCFNIEQRKIAWSRHLLTDYGGRLPGWGVSQSPLVYKETVIVAPQSKSVGLVAFKKETGAEAWKSPPIGNMAHVSPILTTIEGVDQIVIVASDSSISGIAAADGSLLWKFKGSWKNSIPIPVVTPIGDGRIFITGGYDCGSMMIKVARTDGKFAAGELWAVKQHGAILHPAIPFKDHLYINCTTKGVFDGLLCMDLDGKVKWKTDKNPNFEKGATLLADGLLFALDGNTGQLRLIDPNPDAYKELAIAKVLDAKGKTVWAAMSLSDGKLFVRDQKQLRCLAVK